MDARSKFFEEYIRRPYADLEAAKAELAALRAENERLRDALIEIAKDPREDSVCIGSGWDFYTDAMNYAKESLK